MTLRGPVSCDSCGKLVHEPNRFRHAACPPPEDIRRAMDEVREQIAQMKRGSRR